MLLLQLLFPYSDEMTCLPCKALRKSLWTKTGGVNKHLHSLQQALETQRKASWARWCMTFFNRAWLGMLRMCHDGVPHTSLLHSFPGWRRLGLLTQITHSRHFPFSQGWVSAMSWCCRLADSLYWIKACFVWSRSQDNWRLCDYDRASGMNFIAVMPFLTFCSFLSGSFMQCQYESLSLSG